MTEHSDPAAAAFERALQQHAHEAPPADGLFERVRARVDRRRRNRRIGASLLAAAAVAGLVMVAAWMAGGLPSKRSEPAQPPTPTTAPAGWKWESSRGVEVLVPDTWHYGQTYSPYPRCWPTDIDVGGPSRAGEPYVGRAAGLSVFGEIPHREICPRIQDRTTFVWFDDYQAQPGIREHDHDWVEETRLVTGVKVTVFTDDDALRHKVMDSRRPVGDTDVYGCPIDHPVAEHPDTRPSGGGLATVGAVDSISVCSYTSEQMPGEDLPPLLASSRLTPAPDAQQVVEAILAAPEGSGPNGRRGNRPASKGCADYHPAAFPEGPYGYERMLLIVHGSQHDQEVVVRFSGCDYHGTDDGQVERWLTADVTRPLFDFDGPTHPYYGLTAPIPIP
jgi:hypothetical protein